MEPSIESLYLIDLEHLGLPGAIATYLLLDPEPALIDPGPTTTLETLRKGLALQGLEISDLRHVFLTHVHLDHAGVTGHLARESEQLLVHVHTEGAPHILDPEHLVASTRRTFGGAHDRLWGEVLPVPEGQVHPWHPEQSASLGEVTVVPSPGHISHHLSYLHEGTGVLFAGDSLGIILTPESPSHPATPPPGVDLRAWEDTLRIYADYDPTWVGVTHFGLQPDFHRRRGEIFGYMRALETRVRDALARGEEGDALAYGATVRDEQARFLARDRVDRYFDTFKAETDWAGVKRWVVKSRG